MRLASTTRWLPTWRPVRPHRHHRRKIQLANALHQLKPFNDAHAHTLNAPSPHAHARGKRLSSRTNPEDRACSQGCRQGAASGSLTGCAHKVGYGDHAAYQPPERLANAFFNKMASKRIIGCKRMSYLCCANGKDWASEQPGPDREGRI